MSNFTFRPAVRQGINLIIGIAGGTGSGKTYSAMALATGMAGGKRFAVIDTEAGRALHYADIFTFDHGDLRAPFTPNAYTEAIVAADEAGYPVIVVDSMSHEWAGDGGVLDMQEAELDRMGGTDWDKRERVKMASWIKPKGEHKSMMAKLLQVRAHLILCFRAEPKVEMVRNPETRRMEILPKATLTGIDGWVPVSEKMLPFELTASFLMMASAPGTPKPIKLPEQLRECFALDRCVTEESGRKAAAWAAGGVEVDWRQKHRDAIVIADDLEQLETVTNAAYAEAKQHNDRAAYKEFRTLFMTVKDAIEKQRAPTSGEQT